MSQETLGGRQHEKRVVEKPRNPYVTMLANRLTRAVQTRDALNNGEGHEPWQRPLTERTIYSTYCDLRAEGETDIAARIIQTKENPLQPEPLPRTNIP